MNNLRIFLTNLGKYNEGELVGEWVDLPTTRDEMKVVFNRLSIGKSPYEEYFITDYESETITGLTEMLGEYENLDELNYLASRLDELDTYDTSVFEAAIEAGIPRDIADLIDLTNNLDDLILLTDVNDDEDLGYYYADELGCIEIPENIKCYFDYEAYGRDIRLEGDGTFTMNGFLVDSHYEFERLYVDANDIPEEYIITRDVDEDEADGLTLRYSLNFPSIDW